MKGEKEVGLSWLDKGVNKIIKKFFSHGGYYESGNKRKR